MVAKHEREPGVEGVCTQLADRWGMQRSPLQHRRRDAAGVRELEPVAPVPPAAGGGVDRDAEPRDRDGGHRQQPEHDHGPARPGLAAQAPQQIAGRRSPQRPGQQRAAHRRQQQCQRPWPQQVHERQHRRRPQHHRVSEAEHPRQPGGDRCLAGRERRHRGDRTARENDGDGHDGEDHPWEGTVRGCPAMSRRAGARQVPPPVAEGARGDQRAVARGDHAGLGEHDVHAGRRRSAGQRRRDRPASGGQIGDLGRAASCGIARWPTPCAGSRTGHRCGRTAAG